METEYSSRSGGVIGLLVLILAAWFLYHFLFPDYSKPWWSGTEYQNVCRVHVPAENAGCYSLAVTEENEQVVEIAFPNGGYVTVFDSLCDKATTNEGLARGGRYCVATDSEGRDWQINEKR